LILSDINCLVNTHELDWGYILQATEEYQLTRALLITLVQVSTKLNTKIPKQVLQNLGADQLDLSVLGTVEDLMLSKLETYKNINEHSTRILYSNSVITRLRVLASRIFVSPIEIANEFPVSARSLLVYFYYPRRWWHQITQRGPALIRAYHNKNTTYKFAMQKQQLGHWLQDNH
jgi:hypothetical protein